MSSNSTLQDVASVEADPGVRRDSSGLASWSLTDPAQQFSGLSSSRFGLSRRCCSRADLADAQQRTGVDTQNRNGKSCWGLIDRPRSSIIRAIPAVT